MNINDLYQLLKNRSRIPKTCIKLDFHSLLNVVQNISSDLNEEQKEFLWYLEKSYKYIPTSSVHLNVSSITITFNEEEMAFIQTFELDLHINPEATKSVRVSRDLTLNILESLVK